MAKKMIYQNEDEIVVAPAVVVMVVVVVVVVVVVSWLFGCLFFLFLMFGDANLDDHNGDGENKHRQI